MFFSSFRLLHLNVNEKLSLNQLGFLHVLMLSFIICIACVLRVRNYDAFAVPISSHKTPPYSCDAEGLIELWIRQNNDYDLRRTQKQHPPAVI